MPVVGATDRMVGMVLGSVELIAETPCLWRARRPGARHRLICFPHAGAGAGVFADWVDAVPPEIEVVAVQLPGRQNRIAEQPVTEVAPLVRTLTQTLRPAMTGPYSFFGHSCGASLAFEVARALHARGSRGPAQLFLSAQPAPERSWRRPTLHQLPDAEFRAELVRLGGIEPEIAGDERAMTALLPIVRADFRLWERHRVLPGDRLDCDITVLLGDADVRTPQDSVEEWREYTNNRFDVRVFPGGHFYFRELLTEVGDLIGQTVLTGGRS